MSRHAHSHIRLYTVILFLILWGLYGSVTNLWDQYGYNLMHAGVEALVERGHFHLEGSGTPKFSQIEKAEPAPGRDSSTDVFRHSGHLYAVKHPGMFFLGAIVYKPLQLVGIRYEQEYNLATSLVSWLTSGLLGALVVALIFSQAFQENLSLHDSLVVALSLGIGSIFFPYSGVLHHDFLGGCFLYFSYHLMCGPVAREDRRLWRHLLGGFLAGYAFTTSPLAILFLVPFAITVLWKKGWRNLFYFAVGYILGVLPFLLYNGACFGNPFLLPNKAGGVTDTRLGFSLNQMWNKFLWYFILPRSALWTYAPVFYFALAGLIIRAVKKQRDAIILLGGSFLLFLYIHLIETYGGATFGPRYLLPAFPLLTVGLIPILGWIEKEREQGFKTWTRVAWIVLGLAFCVGITICFSGALRGTMYGMEEHPFLYRLKMGLGLSRFQGTPGPYPLLYPVIFIISLVFYFFPAILEQKSEKEK